MHFRSEPYHPPPLTLSNTLRRHTLRTAVPRRKAFGSLPTPPNRRGPLARTRRRPPLYFRCTEIDRRWAIFGAQQHLVAGWTRLTCVPRPCRRPFAGGLPAAQSKQSAHVCRAHNVCDPAARLTLSCRTLI